MTLDYSKANFLLCIKLTVSRCMIAALHNKHLNFTCFNNPDFGKNIALLKMVKATGHRLLDTPPPYDTLSTPCTFPLLVIGTTLVTLRTPWSNWYRTVETVLARVPAGI